ncbi:GntR family transcriptional regulator [Pseudonocardia sp. TRM90224]|uniref:GntR family transcriptional regulator n=1 Tax=Pseudonocardia sp. TRM90224 TaxID=2812678 RepID=UPI001E4F6CB2|nr:GntR family transcriptional regulator [Pseudonocardia sp. TRM90224]
MSLSLPPLGRSTTRSDLVAASIRTAILSGQLKPDEVLVERKLADLLGVSKTPVREALIALTSSGLLTPTRGRGLAVRRLEDADVRRVYEMRVLLEPWAAGRAAESPTTDVEEAARALDEAARCAQAGDRLGLMLANRRFHRHLYAGCDNPLVVTALDDLQDLTALGIVTLLWEQWPTWQVEAGEHRDILAAVKDHRPEAAEKLLREHIESSIKRLA